MRNAAPTTSSIEVLNIQELLTERDHLVTTSRLSHSSSAKSGLSKSPLQIILNRGIEGSVLEDIDGENDISEQSHFKNLDRISPPSYQSPQI